VRDGVKRSLSASESLIFIQFQIRERLHVGNVIRIVVSYVLVGKFGIYVPGRLPSSLKCHRRSNAAISEKLTE
jgi:hypothetical protein